MITADIATSRASSDASRHHQGNPTNGRRANFSNPFMPEPLWGGGLLTPVRTLKRQVRSDAASTIVLNRVSKLGAMLQLAMPRVSVFRITLLY